MSTLNNNNKCQKGGIALQYMSFQKSLLIKTVTVSVKVAK